MREFFKGWKRKLGVVTLLMACALMSGWMRSDRGTDGICLPIGSDVAWLLESRTNVIRVSKLETVVAGTKRAILDPCTMLIIPYWLIVVPLTLLSSYLLFSKPRKKVQETGGRGTLP